MSTQQTRRCELAGLPTELLLQIAKELGDTRDLAALCRVSHRFYGIALPLLYSSLPVDSKYLHLASGSGVSHFFRGPSGSANAGLFFVKDLRFVHPVRLNPDLNSSNRFNRLAVRAAKVIEGIPQGQLESFTWSLKTSIPSKVIGQSGVLPALQPQLKSLSLATKYFDHEAGSQNNNVEVPFLANFQSLVNFSWRFICPGPCFDALKECLQANRRRLRSLELELFEEAISGINFEPYIDEQNQVNNFATSILGIHPGRMDVLYPAIRELCLAFVSFRFIPQEVAAAFQLWNLKSLRLRQCPLVNNVLRAMMRSSHEIQLKRLEIVMIAPYHEQHLTHLPDFYIDSLPEFLRSFSGLKDLFLVLLSPPHTTEEYWDGILNHRQTLERLVYDEIIIENSFPMQFQKILSQNASCDLVALWLATNFSLRCLGWFCPTEALVDRFLKKPLMRCEILHIRVTSFLRFTFSMLSARDLAAEEQWNDEKKARDNEVKAAISSRLRWPLVEASAFVEFATLAFGQEGIHELKYIALGDFSRPQLMASFVLHRVGPPSNNVTFRLLEDNNEPVWRDFWKDRAFIEACPVDVFLGDLDLYL